MAERAYRTVKARVPHRCDARNDYPYPCLRTIEPGTQYIRAVAFPGDVNSSTVPWVMHLCANCANSYSDTRDLIDAVVDAAAASV